MEKQDQSLATDNLTNLPSLDEKPWVERNGFSHGWTAVLWVVIGFVSFQVVGGIVGAIAIVVAAPDLSNMDAILAAFSERLDLVFIGNTFAQFAIICGGSLLVLKMHAVKGKRKQFIRWQKGENLIPVTLLTVVLFVIAQPGIAYLGWLNSFLPVPEFFSEAQDTMLEMITGFLKTDNAMLLGVLHIGFVPAICEEVMFRGYVMRSLEKSRGIVFGLVMSSFLFGLFHLQLQNLVPLAMLGFLMAYVTWISDSLIPAMIAHLLNNGGQVIAGTLNPEFLETQQSETFDLPIIWVVLSIVGSIALLYAMLQIKNKSKQVDGAV